MTTDDCFHAHLNDLLELVSCKGDKYKYSIKNSRLNCTVYKTANKKTIELPVTTMNNANVKEVINAYFADYMIHALQQHYTVFSSIINSINFKLVIEINEQQDLLNMYYKVAFFSKDTNTIVRICPMDTMLNDFTHTRKNISIENSKHKIVHNLFGLTLENDFIFDENGITLIEMLSI